MKPILRPGLLLAGLAGCISPTADDDPLAGREVLYAAQGNIHVMRLDRSAHRTVRGQGTAALPVWSRDGRHIFFVASGAEGYDVYRIDADGTNEVRLTTVVDASDGTTTQLTGDHGEHADWSADGWILFRSGMRLVAIRPDGTGARDLGALPGSQAVRWKP